MSFIRIGSRLANGSRSGAYVYNDGEHINIHLASTCAKRRRCDQTVRLTHEELVAIAKSCVARGWVAAPKTDQGVVAEHSD